MVTRWSEEDTLKLIELYKTYDFLWDKSSISYKNLYARKQAYDAIVKAMNIRGLTSQDVRSKIKNLRTSYYQELRKLASFKAKNRVLRPLRWFTAFKSVMGYITFDGSAKPAESNTDSEEDEECEEEETNQMDLFVEESTSNSDAYVVSIKQEFLDEMDNLGDKIMPPTICDYLEPVAPKRPKAIEVKEIRKHEREIEKPPKRTKRVDEFQMFANNIAQQLRKLPLPRALNLQVEVQTMIAKERIDFINKQNELNQEEEYQ